MQSKEIDRVAQGLEQLLELVVAVQTCEQSLSPEQARALARVAAKAAELTSLSGEALGLERVFEEPERWSEESLAQAWGQAAE